MSEAVTLLLIAAIAGYLAWKTYRLKELPKERCWRKLEHRALQLRWPE